MRQGGVVAQLAVLVARDVVDFADGRKHFRLFHGINPEIGFEIEIQVQHVSRIAGLLYGQSQDAILHRIVGATCRNCSSCWCRDFDFFLYLECSTGGAAVAKSGRFSYTKRMTCARVG